MTLTEITDKADAQVTPFWAELITRQDAYYTKHGKYFQLLRSPQTKVVDGADNDFSTTHPSDESKQTDVQFNWVSKIPFNISIHTYASVGEQGYRAEVSIELPNGDIYTRNRKFRDQRVLTQDYDAEGNEVGAPYIVGGTSEEDATWNKVVIEK